MEDQYVVLVGFHYVDIDDVPRFNLEQAKAEMNRLLEEESSETNIYLLRIVRRSVMMPQRFDFGDPQ